MPPGERDGPAEHTPLMKQRAPDTVTRERAMHTRLSTTLERSRTKIYRELIDRTEDEPANDLDTWLPPFRYRSLSAPGAKHPFILRVDEQGKQEEVLNGALLEQIYPDFLVETLRISPDQTRLALLLRHPQEEETSLMILDISTRDVTLIPVPRLQQVEWLGGSKRLALVVGEEGQSSHVYTITPQVSSQLHPLLILSDPSQTVLLQHAHDASVLFLIVHDLLRSSGFLISAGDPEPHLLKVADFTHTETPRIDTDGKSLYYLAVDSSGENVLMRCPLQQPSSCEALSARSVPELAGAVIADFDLAQESLFLFARRDGQERLYRIGHEGHTPIEITIPGVIRTVRRAPSGSPLLPTFRFRSESYILPRTFYDLELKSNSLRLVWQEHATSFPEERYVEQLLQIDAGGGSKIPVTLTYRRDLFKEGENPLLLETYGAYGVTSEARFSAAHLALLDRGIVLAHAHIRGGGFYGDRWHRAATRVRKEVSVDDLLLVTHELIRQNWCSKSNIFLRGRSAGAIAILGAATRERQLYRGILLDRPFTDPGKALENTDHPLSPRERDEWGDLNVPVERQAVQLFSPIERLSAGPFPSAYFTTTIADRRVPFQDPLNWILKARRVVSSPSLFAIDIQEGGNHGGAATEKEQLESEALKIAFVLSLVEGE